MELLPFYVPAVFVVTTLVTVFFLYKATRYSKPTLIVLLLWLGIQAAIGLSKFYTVTNVMPPRFGLLMLPPVLFIGVLFLTPKGRRYIDGMDAKTLTLLHVVRVPVELTLYWLFLHKAVPQVMTFEGRNLDVLSGLTALLVYYFGYVRKVLPRGVLIAWNVLCLLLLLNIVMTAILSAPFPIQQLGFEQPNVALLYFPYVWLPCCVVPVVLLAHLVVLRRLVYRITS